MTTVTTREQGYAGFSPEIVRIVTTSSLSQVTTAGWYNNSVNTGESLSNVNLIEICYSYATTSQTTALFTVSISSSVVTLSLLGANLVYPTLTANNLKYGATPVAQVDPGSCTIAPAAGAANVCNLTIQLKDGSGTNIARSIRFRLYASSASSGLTLASAASTGFAVASGGLSLANGSAVTTQIEAMSSASGACVVSLTDTGKQTSYIVLALPTGNKISAQLTTGNYG